MAPLISATAPSPAVSRTPPLLPILLAVILGHADDWGDDPAAWGGQVEDWGGESEPWGGLERLPWGTDAGFQSRTGTHNHKKDA